MEFTPRVVRDLEIQAAISEPLLDGLVGVTWQGGFGTARAAFSDPELGVAFPHGSWPVAGKTGTAERDGLADTDEVSRARSLVEQDARLPEELRSVALTDDEDLAADAAGLLSVLGSDDLGALLAEAVRAEAEAGPEASEGDEVEPGDGD